LIRSGLPSVKHINFVIKHGKGYGATIWPKFNGKYKIRFKEKTFNNETYLRQVMIHELMHTRFWKKGRKKHHTASWRRLEKELFKKSGLPENWINPNTGEQNPERTGPVTQTRSFGFGNHYLLGFHDIKISDINLLKKIFKFYFYSEYSKYEGTNWPTTVVVYEYSNKVPNIELNKEVSEGKFQNRLELSPISSKGEVEIAIYLITKKKNKQFLEKHLESEKNRKEAVNAYQLFHELGRTKFSTEEEQDKFADELLDKYFKEQEFKKINNIKYF